MSPIRQSSSSGISALTFGTRIVDANYELETAELMPEEPAPTAAHARPCPQGPGGEKVLAYRMKTAISAANTAGRPEGKLLNMMEDCLPGCGHWARRSRCRRGAGTGAPVSALRLCQVATPAVHARPTSPLWAPGRRCCRGQCQRGLQCQRKRQQHYHRPRASAAAGLCLHQEPRGHGTDGRSHCSEFAHARPYWSAP